MVMGSDPKPMALSAGFWHSLGMDDAPRLIWCRAGDRYSDLAEEPDDFIALDGNDEVGLVKLMKTGGSDEGRWMWLMQLTLPGERFPRATNGSAETRGAAARASAPAGARSKHFMESTSPI